MRRKQKFVFFSLASTNFRDFYGAKWKIIKAHHRREREPFQQHSFYDKTSQTKIPNWFFGIINCLGSIYHVFRFFANWPKTGAFCERGWQWIFQKSIKSLVHDLFEGILANVLRYFHCQPYKILNFLGMDGF